MERVTHKFARFFGSAAKAILIKDGECFMGFYRARWQVGVSRPPIFEGHLTPGRNAAIFDVTFFGDTKGGLSADMQAEEFAREGGYVKITQ